MAGCIGGDEDSGDDVQDSDGDGVIDSEDYAPQDPDVQEKADVAGPTTSTTTRTTTTETTTTTRTTTTRTTRPPNTTQTETIADESLRVHEDEYQRYSWSLNRTATLSYEFTVREGPPIDVIVTSAEEYRQYEAGNRFQYVGQGSALDSVGDTVTVSLEPREGGGWVLLVDNTEAGVADPPADMTDNVAEVEIFAVIQG